jgi:hypothetical protein
MSEAESGSGSSFEQPAVARPRKGITQSSMGDDDTLSEISEGTASFAKVAMMNEMAKERVRAEKENRERRGADEEGGGGGKKEKEKKSSWFGKVKRAATPSRAAPG